MAQVPVKLSKFDNQPWGFRIQGGKDFSTPITVQKVNGGSLAEKAGLNAGDTIISINGVDALKLRHKEAQDTIVKAGNNFEIVVIRGNVWKPAVVPLPEPKPQQNGEPPLLTKTSLAANQQRKGFTTGNLYNSVPKPYPGRRRSSDKENQLVSLFTRTELKESQEDSDESGSQKGIEYDRSSSASSTNSTDSRKQAAPVMNGTAAQAANQPLSKQYNSPAALYSEESIAETLTAQAEVLSQGVLGVNFKKNERQYNPAQSEVLKMIQEDASVQKSREAGTPCESVESVRKGSQNSRIQSHAFRRLQNALLVDEQEPPVHAMSSRPVGIRPVEPPKPKPKSDEPSVNVQDLTKCGDCDRVIVGIFVKIKGRNLHVECFKCATCGTSLKNIGYYDIGGKLYCDMHARQAAKHNPPAETIERPAQGEATSPVPPAGSEKLRPRAQAAAQLQAAAAQSREPKTPPVGGVRVFPGLLFEEGARDKAQPPTPKPRVEVPKPEPVEPAPEPVPEPEPVAAPEPVAEAVQEVPEVEPQSTEAVEPVAEPAPEPVPEPAPEPEPVVEAVPEPAPEPVQEAQPEQVPETVEQSSQPVEPEPEPVAVEEPAVVEPVQLEAAPAPAPAPAPVLVPEPAPAPAPSPVPPVIKAPAFNPVAAPKQDRPVSGDYQAFVPRPGTKPDTMIDASHREMVETVVQKSSFESFSSMSKSVVQTSSVVQSTSVLPPINPPAPVVKPVQPPVVKPAPVITNPVVAPVVKPAPAPLPKPAVVPAPVITPVVPAPLPKPVVAPAAAFPSAPAAPVVPAPTFTAPYMPGPPAAAPVVGASGQTTSAPRRGKGVLSQKVGPGVRVPVCSACEKQIRGPFVTALGRNWCPEHFVCANESCKRHLQDIGFVEEKNELYCESCFENYLAPVCDKCQKRVVGDCLKAIGKQFHPECFACAYCGRLFGNSRFYLEDGLPYCEADWNELFTTKCFGCGFPIEAGDRWVEAMNNNYHSQCFNCSVCKKNLEGQSFLAKGGKPMCKSHAARI